MASLSMPNHSLITLVTCEHATNYVPRQWEHCFAQDRAVLETHRAYDIGALPIAMRLARKHRASLWVGEITRLLIDLNRSPDAPSLFSEYTRALSEDDRNWLQRRYHERYRKLVIQAVEDALALGLAVVHLSVHTFTPVLEGQNRPLDIGLLFDPNRPQEAKYMGRWAEALEAALPDIRVRDNEPYRGTDDGLTSTLRIQFPPNRYLGLELEVSQDFAQDEDRINRCFGQISQDNGSLGSSRSSSLADH